MRCINGVVDFQVATVPRYIETEVVFCTWSPYNVSPASMGEGEGGRGDIFAIVSHTVFSCHSGREAALR